jgi:hypothetical protein
MRISNYPSSGKITVQVALPAHEVRQLLGPVPNPSQHFVKIAGDWNTGLTLVADGTGKIPPDFHRPSRRLKFMRMDGKKEQYCLQFPAPTLGFPNHLMVAIEPDWRMEGNQMHVKLPMPVQEREPMSRGRRPSKAEKAAKAGPDLLKMRVNDRQPHRPRQEEPFVPKQDPGVENLFENVFNTPFSPRGVDERIAHAHQLVAELNSFLMDNPEIYIHTEKGPSKRLKLVRLIYQDL